MKTKKLVGMMAQGSDGNRSCRIQWQRINNVVIISVSVRIPIGTPAADTLAAAIARFPKGKPK